MKRALCLGTFDGLHKGHIKVLNLPLGYSKTVVTFALPPKLVFSGKRELLMSFEDKVQSLKDLGIEEVLTLDFNLVRDMSPEDFLESLYKKYYPALICCGFNYRFGKGALGDTEQIEEFCKQKGIEFMMAEPVKEDENTISSTLIRDYIKNGEIEKANNLLTKPFSFEEEVIKGDARGRTLGYPTINQKYPEELVKLKFGVYKTKIIIDEKEFEGITNIGIRPTFKTDFVIAETYIKDFSGDLYGKKLRIIPIEFLREEIKFSSIEELKRQIEIDLKK